MANPHFAEFKRKITHPVKFRVFMLTKLPAAWFAGLRVISLSEEKAVVSVRYKWFNKNPFRSIYVAVLAMPSEVSTGILAMAALYKRQTPVSMLVVKSSGTYFKKATGAIHFTCNDGISINNAVEQAIATGDSITVDCQSIGTNEQLEIVATFNYTWSFKTRQVKAKLDT